MSDRLAPTAGKAVLWRGIDLGGAKLIQLARMLILARLLVSEDFGLLAIGMGTVNTVLALSDFGMVPALVQRRDLEADHYQAAWTLGILRALVVAAVVVVGAEPIAGLFDEPRAAPIIRALGLLPIIEAAVSIGIADLTRQLRFRRLAFIGLSGVLTEAIVSIGLASLIGVWGLVVGVLCGALIRVIVSYILAPHRPRLILRASATLPLVQFGRWIFLTGVVAVLGSTLLQIVISRELGTAKLGLYYFAMRLALLPNEVASNVVGAVSFPLHARLQSDPDQSVRAFRTILIGIATLLVPAYVLMIALAPALESHLLGERWIGIAPLIRILALVGMIGLLGDIVGPVLKGLGRPSSVAALEGIQSLVIVLAAWWLATHYGVVGATAAWIPAVAASQILAVAFTLQLLPQPFAGLTRVGLAIGLASVAGGAAALSAENLLPGLTGFAVGLTLGVLTAGGLLLWLDRRFGLGIAQGFSRAFPQVSALLGYPRVG